MVFTGKPSRACQQCKERQVKCDLKHNCRACVRAGLKCSGPRDQNEIIFRDQSSTVARKEMFRQIPKNLNISIDDKARGFFISHYVVGNSRAFDYIPPLVDQVHIEKHLSASLQAVSLAHYYNRNRYPHILQQARKAYVVALRLTNEALRSFDLALRDSTMLAVLLLDLFEKIVNTTPRSFEAISKHIDGALTLAKLRGSKQFQDPIGIRMFAQLSSTILISCVQRDIQPPTDLLELRETASRYLDVEDPKWQYSTTVMRFVGLRVAIKGGTLTPFEIINLANKIDDKFQGILDNISPLWKYEEIQEASTPASYDVYGDYFHVFTDHRITHIWNNTRLSRILLHETIRGQLQQIIDSSLLDPESGDPLIEMKRSEGIIASLSTEICASVPQYTRVRRDKNSPTTLKGVHAVESKSTSAFPTFDDSTSHSSAHPRFFYYPPSEDRDQLYTPFEVARCYSLIFALYIAARSTASPETLRQWVVSRLRFFGDAMGIIEAHSTADVLEGRQDVNPWSVYAALGSYSFSASL